MTSYRKKYIPNELGELVPEGVTLRDPDDFSSKREEILQATASAFEGSFPRTYGKIRMKLENVGYEERSLPDSDAEYDAKREDKFLHSRLRGDVILEDLDTGSILDRKRLTLAKVPLLTDRGVFIHNGTDYTAAHQARLVPGIYHLRRSSGDVAAQFNTKRGSGPGFSISLEPSTGIYRMEVGGSKIPLYSILTKIGYSDAELEEAWGTELLKVNKAKSTSRDWPKAFIKIAKRRAEEAGDDEAKQVEVVKDILNNLLFNRDAVALTLPAIMPQNLT